MIKKVIKIMNSALIETNDSQIANVMLEILTLFTKEKDTA